MVGGVVIPGLDDVGGDEIGAPVVVTDGTGILITSRFVVVS